MRRGLAWPGSVLGVAAVLVAVAVMTTTTSRIPPKPIATHSPRVPQGVPGMDHQGSIADAAWLSQGAIPGKGTRWEQMVRASLLDLHRLSRPDGAVAAGASGRWNYAWPRDSAFVAVALARTGHHGDALRALTFLQRVQLPDGGFEARYLLDGSGTPDDRERQSDGAGWALWAQWEVTRSVGGGGPPAALRPLLDNATRFALAATDDGRRLPPASPDYWEVGVSHTSLGTVAPLLSGLQASQKMYAALGEPERAHRSGSAASRLSALVEQRYGDRYERFGSGWLRGGGMDAAVTFLMLPFVESPTAPSAELVGAWKRYQFDALRPAGGLAPGSQWKQDGISWTPETALVAYTAAATGQPEIAGHWMDWLSGHRSPAGSLPEKVLADGSPAGPAPLAWTASLVILTAAEIEITNAH